MKDFFLNHFVLVMVLLFFIFPLSSQETANSYFNSVSEQYKSIADYTANLVITKGSTVQTAQVQYKRPNLLRLDFSKPNGMVIAVNSSLLRIWVPGYQVTFDQELSGNSAQVPNIATPRGLELLKRYYTVAYASSPDPVPLESGSSIRVVKLRMRWRSSNEGFRELELSINPTQKTIRRIRGITTNGELIIFDFTNIVLNKGLSDSRFDYESPASGNTIEHFLRNPNE